MRLDNKKSKMKRWQLSIFIVLFLSCFVRVVFSNEIEDSQDSSPGALSVSDIEQTINGLSELEGDALTKIQEAILQQEEGEQVRLQDMLSVKMETLIQAQNIESTTQVPDNSSNPLLMVDPSFEIIKGKIYSLNLSPGASVEDLRKRDELVGVIASVEDPKKRYELLDCLEEKERLAQMK